MDSAATSDPLQDIPILQIMGMIPHRYPMLMIDRLVEVVPGMSAVGIKNVTYNEPYFQGHFPQQPLMPGVMMIEAMAQTAAVLVVQTLGIDAASGKLVYFMSVDNARFRRPVVPGDQLRIEVTKQHHRKNVWKFSGQAKVDGRLCAEATYAAMIREY